LTDRNYQRTVFKWHSLSRESSNTEQEDEIEFNNLIYYQEESDSFEMLCLQKSRINPEMIVSNDFVLVIGGENEPYQSMIEIFKFWPDLSLKFV